MQDADIGACSLGEIIMAYDAKGSRCGGLRLRLVVGSITDGLLVQGSVAAVDAYIHLAAIASVRCLNEDYAGRDVVDRSGFVALLEFCRAAAEAPDPVGVRVFRRGLRQFDPTSHLRNGGGAAAIGLRRRPVAM